MKKIQNFPIMLFTTIMGLGGLSMDIFYIFGAGVLFESFRALTAFIFCLLFICYALKLLLFRNSIKAELHHPIKINFFAAFSISLLLLGALFSEFSELSRVLFYAGVVLQSLVTLYVISAWISRDINIEHSNPAWFIPVVANLLIPALVPFDAPWTWFYFSFALFFYIVIFSLLFYRLIFHPGLESKFIPTLFIFIAQSAVAFLGYERLVDFDNFALILLNIAIFFTLLLCFMYKKFLRLKFALSWWVFTFLLATFCLSLLKSAHLGDFFSCAGLAVFGTLCVFVFLCLVGTVKSIIKVATFSHKSFSKF